MALPYGVILWRHVIHQTTEAEVHVFLQLDHCPDGVDDCLVVSLLQWLFWVVIAYEVGCKLLGGNATLAALLRTLGFARVPGILMALGPLVGGMHFLAHLWTLLAGAVAIRQACGFGTVRAAIAALCGMVPYWIVAFLLLN